MYLIDARPFASVNIVRVVSCPKSTGKPDTAMSTRNERLGIGRDAASSASTESVASDRPSWVMMSGVTWTLSATPNSDGPASAGAVCLSTVQPEIASTAAATKSRLVTTCSPQTKEVKNLPPGARPLARVAPIREVHANLPGHADGAAGLVEPVERDLRNRRDRVGATAARQGLERRFLLRLDAHQVE